MGTKVRDLSGWAVICTLMLFVLTLKISFKISVVFYILALLALIPLGMFLIGCKNAKRQAKELGLHLLVLLPVPVWWANKITLNKVNGNPRPRRAYEIHLVDNSKRYLWDNQKIIRDDLNRLADLTQLEGCLLFWETHVPIPSMFRKLVRDQIVKGRAVWEPGRWPIPSPPFMGRLFKKNKEHVRRGALIVPRKETSC